MSSTAKKIEQSNSVDTEGLDEIFVCEDNPDEDNSIGFEVVDSEDEKSSDASDSTDKDLVTDVYWTPEMAAEHFNVSVRTIRRRLKKGTIKGFKTIGKNGPEWKVEPIIQDKPDKNSSDSPDDSDNEDKGESDSLDSLDSEDKDKSDSSDSEDKFDRYHSIDADATVKHSEEMPISRVFEYLAQKDQMLLEKDEKLQSASATIGYLRAQLEHKEEQIKLLTDKEKKLSKWQKFVKWFMGG